jgi:hypothetical protein
VTNVLDNYYYRNVGFFQRRLLWPAASLPCEPALEDVIYGPSGRMRLLLGI